VRISLAGVGKGFGAHTVLSDVTFALGPRARVGLVGPNGVGKSTLLRIVARLETPDRGTVAYDPPSLTVGYLPQEPGARAGETAGAFLERRAGLAQAEHDLEAAAAALASGEDDAAERYEHALARLVSLGGGDFAARARALLRELELEIPLDAAAVHLSGGQLARLSLASVLLSRFDVLLLDEPTNDLDVDGLARLERYLDQVPAALVIVSHDRALLDRVVERVVEIEPQTRRAVAYAGGWSDYVRRRDEARRAAYAAFEQARTRRRELTALLSTRRNEARTQGAGLGERSGGADRRGTHALRTKVRQAERQLERNELPDKPFEPWELQLGFRPQARLSETVVALDGATAVRGAFTLGPLDLDLAPGDRLSVSGRNGSGKSTLLAMLDGTLPLTGGRRTVGRGTVIGALGQGRDGLAGEAPLLEAVCGRTGLAAVEARTLLAKFGLGAEDVGRACATLSPGERTRALLACLQTLGVNTLVLDEPTNHLDLEAIEQLEQALAAFDGTLVVATHDRRFLEAIGLTRSLALPLQ
jgi:ATPase subunit of ABC transporter with duplicated ATPase domains